MVAISTTVGPLRFPIGRLSRCQAVIGRPRTDLPSTRASSTLPALGAAAGCSAAEVVGYAERHGHERDQQGRGDDRAPDEPAHTTLVR